MNTNDYTSADRIIADVVTTVNDESFRNGFQKGWYLSKVQKALQELALETRFFKEVHDFELPPIDLQIPIPTNVFDVREIYLYNGTLCNPNKTQNVYWKRLFNNSGDGVGYTAKVKDDGSNSDDIFVANQNNASHNFRTYNGKKYYANVVNGTVMFSEDCKAFPFVRMVFNGFGVPVGDEPIIPRFFEQAIIDYVEERYYNAMKARNPRTFRILWSDAKNNLDSPTGSWAKARRRAKALDRYEYESMQEYQSSMYHK